MVMEVKLVNYGIAKEIMEGSQLTFEMKDGGTINDLKEALIIQYPRFKQLRSLKFAILEDYQQDSFQLKSGDEVVIIPPVSGG